MQGGAACRTVAPFNEPSTIYWWAGNNQEGCHFDLATQSLIIGKLAAALRGSGLAAAGVGISASDETSIDSALVSLQGYAPPALEAVEQINTHSVRPASPPRMLSACMLPLRRRRAAGAAAEAAVPSPGAVPGEPAQGPARGRAQGGEAAVDERVWVRVVAAQRHEGRAGAVLHHPAGVLHGLPWWALQALRACLLLPQRVRRACAAQDLNVLQANAWVYWQAIENSENGNWWGLLQARTPKPLSGQARASCMLSNGSLVLGTA